MSSEISEEALLSDSLDVFLLDNYESALKHMDSMITKYPENPKKKTSIFYIKQFVI